MKRVVVLMSSQIAGKVFEKIRFDRSIKAVYYLYSQIFPTIGDTEQAVQATKVREKCLKKLEKADGIIAVVDNNSNEYKFILTDGTTMWFYWNGGNACTPDTDECGNIKVDINGKKGKYAFGRDVFIFNITPKGIVPAGMQGATAESFEDTCNMSKKTDANGYGCTAWVLQNENLDYLHCNDLSWDGKHSCRDKVNK